MPFPKTADGRLDFNAYNALTGPERRAILDEANSTINSIKRAFGLSADLSSKDLFKSSASWHAVFRHNGVGTVNTEHLNALPDRSKRILLENMSDGERNQIINATTP